jgi:hypothetical protein
LKYFGSKVNVVLLSLTFENENHFIWKIVGWIQKMLDQTLTYLVFNSWFRKAAKWVFQDENIPKFAKIILYPDGLRQIFALFSRKIQDFLKENLEFSKSEKSSE